jgi:hypothetical protein
MPFPLNLEYASRHSMFFSAIPIGIFASKFLFLNEQSEKMTVPDLVEIWKASEEPWWHPTHMTVRPGAMLYGNKLSNKTTRFQASNIRYFRFCSGMNRFLGWCFLTLGATISSVHPFLSRYIFAFLNSGIPPVV